MKENVIKRFSCNVKKEIGALTYKSLPGVEFRLSRVSYK